MNRQEAQMTAAREVLRALVKASPYTAKYIAQEVGEPYTSFVHRLKGTRQSYRTLDTALVINVLAVVGVSLSDFYTQVEERAEELQQQG